MIRPEVPSAPLPEERSKRPGKAGSATSAGLAQAALDQVVADWNSAGVAWDAAGLADIYTEDGLLFGGRPGHFVGRVSIKDYFASYNGVIRVGTMRMSETELRVLGEGCVLAQGSVDFAFTLAGGEQTCSKLRATLVLLREPDRWRIADHHFSPTPTVPPLGKD